MTQATALPADWTEVSFANDGKRQLRRALGCFATGVTVVTTLSPDGKAEGLTANSFSSVSLDPPLVLWSLRAGAASLDSFTRAGWFAVNVLAAPQQHLSRHFATPMADKFAALGWLPGLGGCPLLEDALARFECTVHTTVPAGDHLIFIGLVRRAGYREGVPLLFSSGSYCVPVPADGTEPTPDAAPVRLGPASR